MMRSTQSWYGNMQVCSRGSSRGIVWCSVVRGPFTPYIRHEGAGISSLREMAFAPSERGRPRCSRRRFWKIIVWGHTQSSASAAHYNMYLARIASQIFLA